MNSTRFGNTAADFSRPESAVALATPEAFRFLAGVETTICRLKETGFIFIVVINQPEFSTISHPRNHRVDAWQGKL